MKTSKKELVEILGIFGVIASLIFVGMQLQLDRKVALAEQYFNRAESAKEDLRARLTSQAYSQYIDESWASGRRPERLQSADIYKRVEEGSISASSAEAITLHLKLAVIGYDNLYFQYQQGLLDEETWSSFRSDLKSSMSEYKLCRDVYLGSARPTIKPLIEEIISEIEFEQQGAE